MTDRQRVARFRSSARTVDMLGRQQIAGASSAVSEIFKNSYDALASEVRLDFFGADRTILIRDNGEGMTPDQFLDNWLTLATDSKLNAQGTRSNRHTLGAKGIGRLAIGILGSQCLVITRSATGDAVLALINWRTFEVPGLALDDIDIPMLLLGRRDNPGPEDARDLVRRAISSAQHLPAPWRDMITHELDAFPCEMVNLLTELPGPNLAHEPSGTQFVISPANPEFAREADAAATRSDLAIDLAGFADTFSPGHREPQLETSVWVHPPNSSPVDLMTETDFFTDEEFQSGDHLIRGEFDDFGTFHGKARIFGEWTNDLTYRWNDGRTRIRCGPFSIALSVIQPELIESSLPPAEHQIMREKLKQLGGVYVYRHGIRILPYGRPDIDWLEIEQYRTKRLSTAFYSHRRMFGAILLDDRNQALEEKAGREGFQQNIAYRHLRDTAKSFLRASAADLFKEGGTNASTYVRRHSEAVDLRSEARRHREEQRQRRDTFAGDVASAFLLIEDGVAAAECDEIVQTFSERVREFRSGESLEPIEVDEARALEKLAELRMKISVNVPPTLGLDRELNRDLAAHERAFAEFEQGPLTTARSQILQLTASASQGRDLRDAAPFIAGRLVEACRR